MPSGNLSPPQPSAILEPGHTQPACLSTPQCSSGYREEKMIQRPGRKGLPLAVRTVEKRGVSRRPALLTEKEWEVWVWKAGWWRDLSCPVSCLSLSLLFLLSTHPDWAADALQSQLPVSQLATLRSSLLVLLLRFSRSLPHVLLH